MKNIKNKINLLRSVSRRLFQFSFVILFIFVSNISLVSQVVTALAPGAVTTTNALGVKKTKATLEGITSLSDTTERGFQFGTTISYGQTIQDTSPKTEFATVVHSGLTGDDAPRKIAIDTNDDMLVLYNEQWGQSAKIVKYNSSGDKLLEFSGWGMTDGLLRNPQSIDTDSLNNIYVADTDNNRVQKFDSSGNFVLAFGTQGSADGEFYEPRSISTDSEDNLYVADKNNAKIKKFDSSGNFLSSFGESGFDNGQFTSLVSATVDSQGNIYTLENFDNSGIYMNRVQKFNSNGDFLLSWNDENSNDLDFDHPISIKTDNNNDIYILSDGTYHIQKYNPQGTYIKGWVYYNYEAPGDDNFARDPGDAAFDSANNFYVADGGNVRVQRSGTSIQAELTSLSCNTQYNYRAYTVNSSGTQYGDNRTFTTDACAAGDGLQFVTDQQLPNIVWDTQNGYGTESYSASLETTGGTGSSRYEVIEGVPPTGVDLQGSYLYGHIYDNDVIPDSTYTFTIAAYDEAGQSVTKRFSIYIPPLPPISFPADPLPDITQNVYYSAYFGLDWQKSPITSTIVSGALPPGMQLRIDDIGYFSNIRGTATAVGSWTFTVQSTDGTNTATKEYTLTVLPHTITPPVYPQTAVTITSPQSTEQITGPEVSLKGRAPANKLIEVYIDDVHVGGSRANASGDWEYIARNLVAGTHQFKVRYTPEKKVLYVPSSVQTQTGYGIQSSIKTVDAASGDIIDSYDLLDGLLLGSITVNGDGTKLYLSTISFRDQSDHLFSSRVYEYDPASRTLDIFYDAGPIISGNSTNAILSDDESKVYVVEFNSVKIIDITTKQVIQTVPIGVPLSEVALQGSGTISIPLENTLSPDGKTINTLFFEIENNQQGINTTQLKLKTTETETLFSREITLDSDYRIPYSDENPLVFPKIVQGDDETYILYRGNTGSNRVDRVDAVSGAITNVVTTDLLRGTNPDAFISDGIFDKSTNSLYLSVLSADLGESNPFPTMKAGYIRLNEDGSTTSFMTADGYDISTGVAGMYFDESTHTIYKPYTLKFIEPYYQIKAESFNTQTGEFQYTDATLPEYIQYFPSQGSNSFGGSEPSQYAYTNLTILEGEPVESTDPGESTGPSYPANPSTPTYTPGATVEPNTPKNTSTPIPSPATAAAQPKTAVDAGRKVESEIYMAPSSQPTYGLRGSSPTAVQRAVESMARKLGLAPPMFVAAIPWLLLILFLLFVAILTTMLMYQLSVIKKIRLLVKKQQLLNHEKRSLMALSTHYLRTPLTILSAGIDMLPNESNAKKVIQPKLETLASTVSSIIEHIGEGSGLSEAWHPSEERVRRMSLFQPRVLVPTSIVLTVIIGFNVLIATTTDILVDVNNALLQILATMIIAALLYFVYDSRRQHSAIKSYQEELLRHQESLEEARNRLIKGVADELVPAIIAVDSVVPTSLPDETTRIMKHGLQQFEATAANFMLISQLEQKQLRQKAVATSLKSVVDTATQQLQDTSKLVDASAVGPVKIKQPEYLLRRVIGSLLSNASTHGESDRPTVVASTTKGDKSALKVVDYGKGIEKEKLSLLFKPLSRVEEAEDFTHEGVGLSLYVNRLIMHYLGGTISAQSDVGKGTTMTVVIPHDYNK